jgi:hypothetical protein
MYIWKEKTKEVKKYAIGIKKKKKKMLIQNGRILIFFSCPDTFSVTNQ